MAIPTHHGPVEKESRASRAFGRVDPIRLTPESRNQVRRRPYVKPLLRALDPAIASKLITAATPAEVAQITGGAGVLNTKWVLMCSTCKVDIELTQTRAVGDNEERLEHGIDDSNRIVEHRGHALVIVEMGRVANPRPKRLVVK